MRYKPLSTLCGMVLSTAAALVLIGCNGKTGATGPGGGPGRHRRHRSHRAHHAPGGTTHTR